MNRLTLVRPESYTYRLAVAWNALAEGIQGEQNYNSFKRKLNEHNLHCIYFVSYAITIGKLIMIITTSMNYYNYSMN